MAQEQKFNLLPDDERRKAEEELKRKRGASPEVRLVVPEIEGAIPGAKKGKESWWARRKRRQAEKKAEKMRRKGETGSVKEPVKKDASSKPASASIKPELFSDVMKKEPNEHWWERKQQTLPPKTEPEKEKKTSMETQLTASKPMQQSKPDDRPKPHPVEQKQEKAKKGSMHEPASSMAFSGPSINLVPEGLQSAQRASHVWPLALAIVIFTVAFWVITSGLTYARVSRARTEDQQLRAQIAQLDKVISDAQASRQAAKQLQTQYEAVGQLINNHIYWSVFLQKLEELTIPDVYYVSLDGDLASNRVTLRLIAKDYAAAARQIRSFERSGGLIASVRVGEARIENQPDVRLPVPIVAVDLELTLIEGVLKVLPETTSN